MTQPQTMPPDVAATTRDRATVVASTEFCYEPPPSAIAARRILVKPNLGYPVGPPVTVGRAALGEVLRSLRAANPTAEILVVEGVCSPVPLTAIAAKLGIDQLLDEGMQLLDADTLPMAEYANQLAEPTRYGSMVAPALLDEVDCRISVGAFKQTSLKATPLLSASLKNLYGLFPRDRYRARSPHSRGQLHRPSVPAILRDVYGCIGHRFDGAVVDATVQYHSHDWKPDRAGAGVAIGKVAFGTDPIAVDLAACEAAGMAPAPYLLEIHGVRDRGFR